MVRENLYNAFSIECKTLDECLKEAHGHSFFELVYILSGTGVQCINNNQLDYHAGHLFLITPADCHHFDIQSTTTFFILRFNDIYIKDSGIPAEYISKLEYILQNANHRPGCVLKNVEDRLIVKPLVDAILREDLHHDISHYELMQQYVNTLILIVSRNIAKFQGMYVTEYPEEKAVEILQFIQTNIFYPEKLRTEYLGNRFNLSTAYVGRYFKKHTGQTMQDYITHYKTQLIEHRLEYSDKRINEISNEFGFTDESHFNKFFRKQKGLSPKFFRRELKNKIDA